MKDDELPYPPSVQPMMDFDDPNYLREHCAREIMKHLDERMGPERARSAIKRTREVMEQMLRDRAASLREHGVKATMRTCLTPDGKFKVQLRGDGRSLFLLGLPINDDTNEQMCDDWTDWEEV